MIVHAVFERDLDLEIDFDQTFSKDKKEKPQTMLLPSPLKNDSFYAQNRVCLFIFWDESFRISVGKLCSSFKLNEFFLKILFLFKTFSTLIHDITLQTLKFDKLNYV